MSIFFLGITFKDVIIVPGCLRVEVEISLNIFWLFVTIVN